MQDKSHRKQTRRKFIQKLPGVFIWLSLALIFPASVNGTLFPGLLGFVQLIAALFLATLLVVTIVGSYIHMKRKKAEKYKKDDHTV